MPNRLAQETSPYLLQHSDNPVDWYPWGEEALSRARRDERPILLSVGYSACHWCHVMERESFEDPETAAFMNEHFVNVKVDREERPDVDAIYMDAVQAMTGRGGWPMTVFLDPDGVPFYGGTYFPPDESRGMPSFRTVMEAVLDAFRGRREEIRERAEAVRSSLAAAG
ncbi:MAG: thioredoxin domain-containing protein, partial [Syntrophothermus sp.]